MKTTFFKTRGLKRKDIDQLCEIKLFIELNLNKELTLENIAARFSMTTTTMRRHFRLYYRIPVYHFILDSRMKAAKELISKSTLTLGEVSFEVGYKRYTSFFHAFLKYYGAPPSFFMSEFREIVNEQNEQKNAQN